ncbi:hypothetical protein L1987_62634 [Smallanthus sonchifolius]|uniref:Uncharacterized protein n=1 Tax=Smallanthus sonchifolius TaxID=185202 RepID=A0ACB9CAX9_9ASTR|nr:hypothetical protein L1987_62634 [Smallanthus sonchifolius]
MQVTSETNGLKSNSFGVLSIPKKATGSSSDYDRFDIKDGIVCIFRWGFPRKNHRVFLRFLIKDIQSVRIEVKEGIYARRVLYMDIRGQGAIPLTCTDENFTPREMDKKLLNWPISCVYQLKYFKK